MTIVTSCDTPLEKVEKAEKNAIAANQDLTNADKEYLVDIENCKKETAEKISDNNKRLLDFQKRIENKKNEAKADYKDKIADLNKKNSNMEKKMEDYQAEGKEKWKTFKSEFNHDMNELGKTFKELTDTEIK